jgi:hypothetical protein
MTVLCRYGARCTNASAFEGEEALGTRVLGIFADDIVLRHGLTNGYV